MYENHVEQKKKSMSFLLKQARSDMIDFRLNTRGSTHTNSTLPPPHTLMATTTFLRIGRDQYIFKNQVCREIDVVHD